MYKVNIHRFYVSADVTDMDEIQIKGKEFMHKSIPGIIDVFPDIKFKFSPMIGNIVIDNDSADVTTIDENMYNRIILQNGNDVVNDPLDDTRKHIRKNDSHGLFYIAIIKE